ncbi:DUF1566 domain-containing protein [Pseudomonas qingdaonensis]|uniref:DUF1566 domain-containing protein n=1 Tax=Pseudomonas qingdaonensis TaxID=2056231 RepID=UPI0028ABA7DF|nr:DUF1566 domain-containing protein [Pseudomonas qingdaonensis]
MKQAPLVQAKNFSLTLNFFAPEAPQAEVAQLAAGFTVPLSEVKPVAPTSSLTPPAIGEYWPGQGGIYAGIRQYAEGLCHVIFAAQDVGKHAYGEYGTEVEATSQIDGRANTAILVNRDGSHPAADAAYAFTCDGHNDFYLPASGELHHGYLYLPEAFEKAWYVSSSQRSAYDAFSMYFDGGYQYYSVKHNELRVRPVRRFLQ